MKRKQLGNSDVQVSPLTFGAWAISGWMWGGADEKQAIEAVRTALDLGMTTIDTAAVYGFGKSEELIGKAREGVPRDSYQILTQYGLNLVSEHRDYQAESADENGNPVTVSRWMPNE